MKLESSQNELGTLFWVAHWVIDIPEEFQTEYSARHLKPSDLAEAGARALEVGLGFWKADMIRGPDRHTIWTHFSIKLWLSLLRRSRSE
mgnify:CR=1 FL=1